MPENNEPLPDYERRVLAARASGDTLRNGQGADLTPAEARAELLRHGYIEVPGKEDPEIPRFSVVPKAALDA